jgi:hypothetical protein
MMQKKTTFGIVFLLLFVIGLPCQAFSAGLFTKIKDKAIMKWAGCYKKGRVMERQCDDRDPLNHMRVVKCQDKADHFIMKCRLDKSKLKPGSTPQDVLRELEAVRDGVQNQINQCREECSNAYNQAFRAYGKRFNKKYKADIRTGNAIQATARKRIKSIAKDRTGSKEEANMRKIEKAFTDMKTNAGEMQIDFSGKTKLARKLALQEKFCLRGRGDYRERCQAPLEKSVKAVDAWEAELTEFKNRELGPGPANEGSSGPKTTLERCLKGCDAEEARLYKNIINDENEVLERHINKTQ